VTEAGTPDPVYRRIAGYLRDEVSAGRLRRGERLPSETELMTRFGVSRITVRHAISVLAREGLVDTRHGSGSYVRQPTFHYQLYRLSSFAEVMRSRGIQPSSQVLAYEASTPPEEVAAALETRRAYRLERLRLVDDEPLCHDLTWLPADLAERLSIDDLRERTLYELYEDLLGLQVVGASHQMEAVGAPASTARLLGVPRGAPLLVVQRLTEGEGGAPLDWQRRAYRGDRFQLELELLRHPLSWPPPNQGTNPAPPSL
jgi:GntR family transcriptional regulator